MGGGHEALPALCAFAGEEDVAPQLESEQAPDAVGGVFAAGDLEVEEFVEGSGVDVGGEKSVLGAHDLEDTSGARIAQPLAERGGKPHLLAVNDLVRDEALDSLLDDVLSLAI